MLNGNHLILSPSSFVYARPTPAGSRREVSPRRAPGHFLGGAGGLQSHQPCVKPTPQSVHTHTPQTSVPLQVLVQHVAAGEASKSAGSLFSTSSTCTPNGRLPPSSFVKPLSTSRVSAASIVSL